MERCVQFLITCCCLLTIVSCGSNHSQPLALLTADSLITNHPDSALLLLAEIAADAETWPREDRMLYYLLRNRAEEKCHIVHDDDSVMQEAVRYFDKHGSSQERALAWFELGRVYDEMQLTGDAPRGCRLDDGLRRYGRHGRDLLHACYRQVLSGVHLRGELR